MPLQFDGSADFGVDLRWSPVAVLDDVVLAVQIGESFGQGQMVPEALVDPGDPLPWRHASQHLSDQRSRRDFLPGKEGQRQFASRWRKQILDVVFRLRARTRGHHPQD
ncbi:hypothetical protein ACIRP3_42130 [Streptomyces sp. NPDC101209]|uniref:hypothetical protein n=1 Tax=Streptomyces sp. NPDC101209 TaxID=3366129 RepID=UPI003818D133